MEINIEADGTGRKGEGISLGAFPNVPPKVKVENSRKEPSRIAALKVS